MERKNSLRDEARPVTKQPASSRVHQCMSPFASTDERGRKFTFFILGLALPIAAALIWSANCRSKHSRKQRVDEAHDITVEDSFPASDPPSAW